MFLKEAASAGAKLLCFPENFSYVGSMEGDSLKIAESLDGPIMKGYCSLARYGQGKIANHLVIESSLM